MMSVPGYRPVLLGILPGLSGKPMRSTCRTVAGAMIRQAVFCLLVLGCVSVASGQAQNGRNSANAFVEKKFSTTYEDYREKEDSFQFHHWVGSFNDREKRSVIVWLQGVTPPLTAPARTIGLGS